MPDPSLIIKSLGSPEAARAVVRRAREHVPAYRRFLESQNLPPAASLADLPPTDKHHYLLTAPYVDLLADNYDRTFTIFRSSGSSGRGFYWPQLKDQQKASVAGLQLFLESSFNIARQKTLAIVGLALGSWIGGDHISWALKSVAIDCPYPFSVFSPGNHHDEIIDMIRNADPFVDQFILFVCPSAIAHLLLRAEQTHHPLPLAKMRYVVLGEPFPESVRTRLQQNARLDAIQSVMLSIYGSADTGVLGVESPVTAAIRQTLDLHPALAQACGFTGPIPHLFHFVAPDAYLESPHGELLITRWQGIPLIRYNLHDSVQLVSFDKLRQRLRAAEIPAPLRQLLTNAPQLPDLLVVAGRADQCLLLCGTNLTEAMLDEAVRCPELANLLTGAYRARIIYEADRQRLAIDLEFKTGQPTDPAALDKIYPQLAAALGRAQPEFLDDWQNVYRPWDHDPDRRILKLTPIPWPGLSGAATIKQRGIQS